MNSVRWLIWNVGIVTLALCGLAGAMDILNSGDTDPYIVVILEHATTGAVGTGIDPNTLDLYYREAFSHVDTKVDLTGTDDQSAAWSSGVACELDATNLPGQYQICLPLDAVDGNPGDIITGRVTNGTYEAYFKIVLDPPTDVRFTVGEVPASTVTLADGAHGGSSTTITLATGATIPADMTKISGDSTAADNAESMFDGTGYAGGTTKLSVNVASQDNIDFGALQKASITAAVPTAANNADAVWDEASTGHTDAGKAGAQVWTDIDAILEDTGTTLDDFVDGVESELAKVPKSDSTESWNTTALEDIADYVWNELLTGHTSTNSSGLTLAQTPYTAYQGPYAGRYATETTGSTSTTTTIYITHTTSSDNDFRVGSTVLVEDTTNRGQMGIVKTYDADTNVITLREALYAAPANGALVYPCPTVPVDQVIWAKTLTAPTAGNSPDTPTLEEALSWLYSRWFNMSVTSGTEYQLYKRDESTVLYEQDYADDGSTLTIGEAKEAD